MSFFKIYFKKIYEYTVHSIRSKLIIITSLIVLTSINILVYVTLIIFEQNITNMVTFLHSKSTKNLSESIHSQLLSYYNQLKNFKYHTSPSIGGSKYNDILAYFSFSLKNNPKGVAKYNSTVMKNYNISSNELYKFVLRKTANLVNTCQNSFFIQNISKKFQQPLWMTYYCSESSLYVFVILFQNIQKKFLEGGSQQASNAYNFLVNGKGDVIFHSNKNLVLEEENLSKFNIVERMFKSSSKNSVIRFKDNLGNSNFGAFERMDDIRLGLVATLPEEIALEGVTMVRWGSFLMTMAVLSVAILFIYYFSNTISNPIRSLVAATKKIQAGKYDQKLKATTKDEVGLLTKSFNTMAAGLGEREKLKGALGKFVNEEIANQVLRGDLGLGGKRSQASIFFSDIRQFTAISEKNGTRTSC